MEERKTIKAPPGTVFVDGPDGTELWFTGQVEPAPPSSCEVVLYNETELRRADWCAADMWEPCGWEIEGIRPSVSVERWRFAP